MAFYSNDTIPDLEGEIWREIEIIEHDAKDYFISNYGRVKSKFKRKYFARKDAKRERLIKWVKNKKGFSFTIKNKEEYIFHSTKRHLLNMYFKKEELKTLENPELTTKGLKVTHK